MTTVRRLSPLLVTTAMLLASCSSTSDDGAEYAIDGCSPRPVSEGWSAARVWDEALLDAIRRDVPAPTVHARNLFHVSAAMWDAWAAYDPDAAGYLVTEKHDAGDADAARDAAISFAAYRILLHRYSLAAGLQETFDQLTATMADRCYRVDYSSTEGDSPAALGNRIAAAYIAHGRDDGSLEDKRYTDTSYRSVNPPLVVADPGAEMRDPSRWQPLALAQLVAQNGVPIPGNVQRFVGPHWGHVDGFALDGSTEGLPIDPGPPPLFGDQAFGQAAIDVIVASSWLDPSDGESIDISPGVLGDSPLGTNAGDGHDRNPATGQPYAPNIVARGDFARVLAEFWADGPQSETPPGHWNTIANTVSDTPGFDFRIGGRGPELDRLEWDVKLYFALNGAVHDAAVAAWGVKGYYDSARPVSMIRYLGGLGQLPLVPGLVEVVTPESAAAGQRHQHLADWIGQVAVRTWQGNPDEPDAEIGGVGWIPAVEWVPYQQPTFVTPAFAGYVSGHSTFSRAAAEVMTAITGSPYFPGGISSWTIPAGDLGFELGPSTDVTLQWATYYDAADQAGTSRIFGGIHILADDFEGRRTGAQCGQDAWALAERHFEATAVAP